MAERIERMRRLVVLDGNAPWVSSLFVAMAAEVDIRILHIGQPRVFKNISKKTWREARHWQTCGTNASERWIIIPGWSKAPGISSWLTRRAIAAAAKETMPDGTTPDARSVGVVFALPQYVEVAETTALRPRVYYAHDPFEYYGWDRDITRNQETRMLKATEATFAISRLLRDDLKARSTRPIFYSPNAVSSDFITSMQDAGADVPADLAGIGYPIVGCTGHINESYDWPILAELSKRLPEVSFVFIGPVAAQTPESRQLMDSVLKGLPNVHWLGAKPHAELPKYLRAFDVCLNPLTPSEHADRRSPLRLYDFLATGKPVVSTPVEEASSHENQVWIGKNAEEIEAIIRQAITGQRRVNAEDRQEYVQRNTWQMRARKVLEKIEESR